MPVDAAQRVEGGRRTRGDVRAEPPLVSIITVVFRDKEELERILQNVFTFDTSQFELIVIDGGSNDGTVELLQQWDEKVDYWLSEPDSGIYDAMNKGIEAARGFYLLHLNAGDRMTYFPARELSDACTENIDVAAFRVLEDGKREFLPSYGRGLRFRNSLHHQGTFYRRDKFPPYDLRFKALADFDVNQRLAKSSVKVKIFDCVVATHSSGGISHSKSAMSEHFLVVRKNHGWLQMIATWSFVHSDKLVAVAIRRIRQILTPSRS
jgi:glycosyltransferase involved in cell wall biosynthesis